MMKNKLLSVLSLIFIACVFTSCFSEKKSPLFNSEWVMQNYDQDNNLYFHQMFLKADHTATIQAYYNNSPNVIVWTGTYKLSANKIVFNFDKCTRFENGNAVGNYVSGKLIKYYTGEFYYSVGLVDDSGKEEYHLQLIRPKNYFYGEALDLFGNPFAEFVKMD